MATDIDIQWERKDGALVAALVGRIDGSTAEQFQRLLESGIEPDDHVLILDFEHLSFISSAGLRVCLIMAKQFNAPGKRLSICTLSASIREVMAISGFDRIITIYESQAAVFHDRGEEQD